MGCTASKSKSNNLVCLEGINLDLEADRHVEEYPFYKGRLSPIDFTTIISEGKPWEDPHFKTEVSAILDDMMQRHERHRKWENFTWKRPAEVYGEGNFSLFDQIAPNDIKQGHCGDCYFLSCLSSLAEFPDRVKKIFITKDVNQAGCYAVQMFINGERRTIVVDDRFPYDQHKEKWAFSRPSQTNEIWVLIVEKAWAKVFGSYQRIEAGTTGEALHPLTGCPTQALIHDERPNKDRLWDAILFADQRKFPMCCAVASQAEEVEQLTSADMKRVGLVDAHAYSLISAKVIDLENGQTERLIKVRNPWGKKEWNGDWSDKSPLWTDHVKSQVDHVDKNDGTFWISFKDYDKFFYVTTICFLKDGYVVNFMPDSHDDNGFGAVKLNHQGDVNEPVVFTLDQVNTRFCDETMRGTYENAAVKLLITRIVERKDKEGKVAKWQAFVDGDYIATNSTMVSFKNGLPKGEYIILYSAEFTNMHPYHKMVISFYADDKTPLKRVNLSEYKKEFYEMMELDLYDRLESKDTEIAVPL